MSTKLKTVNIKWKNYVEVNERIKHFRNTKKYEGWSLQSDVVSIENWVCIIKATIADENWLTRATWIAYEKEGSTFINKTSYIENCETSAWGRALWNLWIGIDVSVASALEVWNAVANQDGWPRDLWEIIEDVKKAKDLAELQKIKNEWVVCARSDKQKQWLWRELKAKKDELIKNHVPEEPTWDIVIDNGLPF